jgi:hypothetical protein
LIFGVSACASAPRPTAETLRVAANPRGTVEGRVTDAAGRPLGGVSVRGIPRGEDVPWSPWVPTGCDGSFRLPLAAPARYAFQLLWKGRSVITESPQDPARQEVPLLPGERRGGIDLVLLSDLWRPITGPEWSPPEPSSCP